VITPGNPPTAAATMSLDLSIPQAATTIFSLKSSSQAAVASRRRRSNHILKLLLQTAAESG